MPVYWKCRRRYSSVGIATRAWRCRSGIRIFAKEVEFSLLQKTSMPPVGPIYLPVQWVPISFLGGGGCYSGRDAKLNTHLHLEKKVRLPHYIPNRRRGNVEVCLCSTSTLESCGWSASHPGNFTMGKENWYTSYSWLDGLRGRPGYVRKISPLLGFEPRNVQHVSIRYTSHPTILCWQ